MKDKKEVEYRKTMRNQCSSLMMDMMKYRSTKQMPLILHQTRDRLIKDYGYEALKATLIHNMDYIVRTLQGISFKNEYAKATYACKIIENKIGDEVKVLTREDNKENEVHDVILETEYNDHIGVKHTATKDVSSLLGDL